MDRYDMNNLTKEQAIELHRKMWNDMNEAGVRNSFLAKSDFKYHWIKEHFDEEIFHDCFLCQYAKQEYIRELQNNPNMTKRICDFCPLDWGELENPYSLSKDDAYCEYSEINWKTAQIYIIANLKEKIKKDVAE